MKEENVPQDSETPTWGGLRKLLYAVDADGRYKDVRSVGWDVEAGATHGAIEEVERLALDAWRRAKAGTTAPLEYHMYKRRMDIALLAQTSGFFQWRIRGHFNPMRFARLPDRVLNRYVEALEIDRASLKSLPPKP